MNTKSKLGYSRNSPYKHLPEIVIKGNVITMAETDIDLYGIPIYKDGSKGKPVLMKAGRKEPYVFKDAVAVLEKPVKTMKNKKFKFQNGGGILDKISATLNPYNWGVPDYSNNKDFKSAFAKAFKNKEEEFMWNNKRYSTNIKTNNPYKKESYKSSMIPTTYLNDLFVKIVGVPYSSNKDTNVNRNPREYNLNEGSLNFARTGEVTDGSVILGGDYMENTPTAKTAYEYRNEKERIHSGGEKIPLDNSKQLYYAVVNNKFKTGNINDFHADDIIVPIRFGGKYERNTIDPEVEKRINKFNDLNTSYNKLIQEDYKKHPEYKNFLNTDFANDNAYEEINFAKYLLSKEKGYDFANYDHTKEGDFIKGVNNTTFKQNGKGVYSSANNGKIILHSPSSGEQIFLYNKNKDEVRKKSQEFLEKHPDAEFISMDTGRYNFTVENKEGLTKKDFVDYSKADLSRGNNLGYNLIYSPPKQKQGGQMKKFRFTKKYQQGGTTPAENYIITEIQGKVTPLFRISQKGLEPMIDPKQFEALDDSVQLRVVNKEGKPQQEKPFTKKEFIKMMNQNKQKQSKKFQFGGSMDNAQMVLLDHVGKPQMYMEGGEIIISGKETRKIIDLASNMGTNPSDEGFYNLGKYVHNVRMKQRKRDGY